MPDMTVQVLAKLDQPPLAAAKTDTKGGFSFPALAPGKFYIKATKNLVGEIVSADSIVTVRRGNTRILCLVAEGVHPGLR